MTPNFINDALNKILAYMNNNREEYSLKKKIKVDTFSLKFIHS